MLRLLQTISEDQKADGFILPRTRLRDKRVDLLRARGIPFVLYGRTEDTQGCAWYDIESEAAMAEAVTTLVALGHRRIGFIPGGSGYTYSALRLAGYREGLRANGLGFDAGLIGPHAVDQSAGERAASRLLTEGATAILCAVDRAALGVYAAAREAGLVIGRDLSVIGYDGIPEGALMVPPLSTYKVDTWRSGVRLVEGLIALIEGKPLEQQRELAQAEFLARGSHGPAPARGARPMHNTQDKTQGGTTWLSN